jgi:acetylornithine deacetylase/succinyl-diaminopimelate desuccinylase-like protein
LDFVSLCKKIISIESTPTSGNADVALFCANLCQEEGLDVVLQERNLRGQKQYNILARPPNQKSKANEEVIFQTHLDTVEPGALGNWTKTDSNPFKATIDGDRIFGLGTTDVKLDFLCKFMALKEFKTQQFKRPFVLVGTYGEEIGMHGARFLIDSKATRAKMAFVGEPSELQIVYANNGFMIIDFEIPFSSEELEYLRGEGSSAERSQEKVFLGKAAHSSTPHLGDNAILKLINYVEKMPKGIAIIRATGGSSVNTVPADANVEVDGTKTFANSVGDKLINLLKELQRLEREFLNFENSEFSPASPTLNMGLLATVEKGLEISVSFRITPDISLSQVDSWVKSLEIFSEGQNISCHKSRLSPPAMTSLKSELVTGAIEISRKLQLPVIPITKASGTECSIYTPQNIDCIVFGPGVSIGNSHTANEYNFLSQLTKAQGFYTEAVKRFCL